MVMLVAHKQKEAVVFPITAHYGSAALEKQIERQNLGQIVPKPQTANERPVPGPLLSHLKL